MKKEDVKIGETYRIRWWDDMKEEFGLDTQSNIRSSPRFVHDMSHLCGAEVRVADVTPWEYIKLEFLNKNIGNTNWSYSADMLEPIEEPIPDVDSASIFVLLGV